MPAPRREEKEENISSGLPKILDTGAVFLLIFIFQ